MASTSRGGRISRVARSTQTARPERLRDGSERQPPGLRTLRMNRRSHAEPAFGVVTNFRWGAGVAKAKHAPAAQSSPVNRRSDWRGPQRGRRPPREAPGTPDGDTSWDMSCDQFKLSPHAGQGRKVHVDGFREDRDDSIKRAVRLSCGTDRVSRRRGRWQLGGAGDPDRGLLQRLLQQAAFRVCSTAPSWANNQTARRFRCPSAPRPELDASDQDFSARGSNPTVL